MLGQIDDWMGRLKVVAVFLAAALVVIAAFGVLRVALLILALMLVAFGVALWRAGSQPHRGIRLTAEGTVYKPEPGGERPSGVEIKYPSGRQDAIATPETVHVGARVNGEEEPAAEARVLGPKLVLPADANGYVTEYEIVGHRLKLSIFNLAGVPFLGGTLRCTVTNPDGIVGVALVARSATSALLGAPEQDAHVDYPSGFNPSRPLIDGPYKVRWDALAPMMVVPPKFLRQDDLRIEEGLIAK